MSASVHRVSAALLLLVAAGCDDTYERGQAAHQQIRPGMTWSEVVAVAESHPQASLRCTEPARASTPPCYRAYFGVQGSVSEYGFTLQMGADGRVYSVGDLEYLD